MRNGNTTRNADDHCCGQTYIDLYNICPSDTNMIRNIKASIDMVVNTPQVNDWWWIDAVQMAMPFFAKFKSSGKSLQLGSATAVSPSRNPLSLPECGCL